MARRGQHSFAKRQREQKKAEKAALKQMRREQRLNPTEPTDDPTEGDVGTEECETTDAVDGCASTDTAPINDDRTETAN